MNPSPEQPRQTPPTPPPARPVIRFDESEIDVRTRPGDTIIVRRARVRNTEDDTGADLSKILRRQ